MKRKEQIFGCILIFTVEFLVSCSNTRFLTGDQQLYTGRSKVAVIGPDKLQNRKAAERVIKSATFYKPNNGLGSKRLFPPAGLWIYNYMKPKGEGKISNWFYKSFSAEPVLISQVAPEMRCQKVTSELFNIGFFHSTVWAEVDSSKRNPRKAKIAYFISLDHPYKYNNISFAAPSSAIDSLVNSYEKNLSIRKDDVFDFETIRSESERIASSVVENGYYYFNSDYVNWTADTNIAPYRVDLECSTSRDLPPEVLRQYTIDNITVRLYGKDDSENLPDFSDTVNYNGIRIVSQTDYLKPEIIAQCIFFKSGDLYSFEKHQQSIQRLNRLGVFKFINVQYSPDEDSLVHHLDMFIELTPVENISLDLEANLVTKSTGFTGPGISASLAHRNIARGANSLILKVNGGFESQWTGHSSSALGTTTYNIGIATSMVFPRIMLPFKSERPSRFILPKTSVTTGFEFMNKIQYYRMRSLNLGLGYQWSRSERNVHVYYPLFFNSVALLKTTPEFDSIINGNPYIRKSFEEQFILGIKYDFIFDRSDNLQPHGLYLHAAVSSSGNLLDLLKSVSASGSERPFTVFQNVYSQFVKISADFRYYRNIRYQSIVFRLFTGVGFPYGNSVVMPYIEQFYSGGANSIRAFSARTLGPGSYNSGETTELIDQTGDIKLEGNVEYRFKVTGILRGAIFLDAGNVWLLNRDESRPGAEFHFNTFISQLAVGTGFGLRFDFGFFVLRTDFGFPLRLAYGAESGTWLKNTKEISSGFTFNLAIGYPF